jgi:hypothetical protein
MNTFNKFKNVLWASRKSIQRVLARLFECFCFLGGHFSISGSIFGWILTQSMTRPT